VRDLRNRDDPRRRVPIAAIDAIDQHAGRGSEANTVIQLFQHKLSPQQKQDLLNFLRSL